MKSTFTPVALSKASDPVIIHRFSNGDILQRDEKAIVACFSGKRKVLSTSPHNGGYRENLKWVFNHDCKQEGQDPSAMEAPTYEEHMVVIASELGLDSDFTAGISTAASMVNASIKSGTYLDTTVTAVVTAGIDINGGRAGDPATWHETDGQVVYTPGTINILLFINADLPEGSLVRALVTCTEAKTAALQELMAPSCYSTGLATGSGTDGTILVANADSKVKLTWAGKHSKLGELIGRMVIMAVKEALFLQTNLCAERQFNILRRLGRFGITEESLWQLSSESGLTRQEFSTRLNNLINQSELVVHTSLYAHLMDQLQWGLIRQADAQPAVKNLFILMEMEPAVLPDPCVDCKQFIEKMVLCYSRGIIKMIEHNGRFCKT